MEVLGTGVVLWSLTDDLQEDIEPKDQFHAVVRDGLTVFIFPVPVPLQD